MENKVVLVRVKSPSTGKSCVYEYRRHDICLVPNSKPCRYELLVEVVETGDESLRKIVLLVLPQKGTYYEMEEMWTNTYEKSSIQSGCLCIEFIE